ncbi:hypothetical protein ABUK73_17830 [Agrobacterium sp. BA1120]|uniref:hypothetical protein n=1 Tax=Agrobacterium sp. BA1120 TaxID=3228927 RepID=UPI00336ABC59
MHADYRREYVDSMVELCDAFYAEAEHENIVWEAEYLTRRDIAYHYYGLMQFGKPCSVAREYSPEACKVERIDPGTLVLTLLDFEANDYIARYSGPSTDAGDILTDMGDLWRLKPEVMRISMLGHSPSIGGGQIVTATEIAYIGLTGRAKQAHQCLAPIKDSPSRQWYRGRRFIRERAPSFA